MSQLAQKLIAENKKTKSPFLDLGNCGLTGLPKELFDCYWLENLNLGYRYYNVETEKFEKSKNQGESNRLSSLKERKSVFNIVSKNRDISNFYNLSILTIDINSEEKFSKKYRISDISMFGSLIGLIILSIENNSVSSIFPLKYLHELRYLNILGNNVSDILPLRNSEKMVKLIMSNNSISDVSVLANLRNLEYLHFGGNLVSNISSIANLQKLQVLCFQVNKVYDISPLQSLKSLYCIYCFQNSIFDISSLKNLHNLQSLQMTNNLVSDISVLSNLQELVAVSLGYNPVSDIIVFSQLRKLEYVCLRGTPALEQLPESIKENYQQEIQGNNQLNIVKHWLENFVNEEEEADNQQVENLLNETKLSESQIDSLVNLVERQHISEFYETLEKYGIFTQESNRLRKEFVLGIHKTDVDYWDRMIIFVKSL